MYVIFSGRTNILRRRDLDQEFSGRGYQVEYPLDARDAYDDLQARAFKLLARG